MTVAFGESASLAGTFANRPAADPTKVGRLYLATDTGVLYRDNGSTWDMVGSLITGQALFTIEGTLTTGEKPLRIYNKTGTAKLISQVFLSVGTPSSGTAITADIHKNGVTIFPTQSNRPQIAAAAYTGTSTTIEVPSWADGDYLTLSIDQIGSGDAGSDLTALIVYS